MISTKQFLRQKWHAAKSAMTGHRYALNELDEKLYRYLSHRNGFYIELGANDGKTQSNTYHLEKKRNWHGVLIEPIPHRFIECRELRGGRNKVFCAACVPSNYKDKFVPMQYADLMTMTEGLAHGVDSTAHFLAAEGHYDNGAAYEFAARARTLTSILDEADAPDEIDFLSLDVEGAELAVLDGLDTQKYKINYILVETRIVDDVKLSLPDYFLKDKLTQHDYLFKRSRMLD